MLCLCCVYAVRVGVRQQVSDAIAHSNSPTVINSHYEEGGAVNSILFDGVQRRYSSMHMRVCYHSSAVCMCVCVCLCVFVFVCAAVQ